MGKPDPARDKDVWDKISVLSEVTKGVLLAALAIVVGIGSDKISTAVESGELTTKLISDLSRSDTSNALRHEIALAALDQSLGPHSPELVWQVSERIFRNAEYSDPDRVYAYRIMLTRDSSRALSVYRDVTRSRVHLGAVDSSGVPAAPDPALQTVADNQIDENGGRGVVLIQFRGAIPRAEAERLREALSQRGYTAPGVERVPGQYGTEVRFFHASDQDLATRVKDLASEFLEQEARAPDVALVDLSGGQFTVPQGQVELWVLAN